MPGSRSISPLIYLLGAALLSGCMNVPTANIPADFYRPDPDQGLLLGSVTQTSDGGYHDKVGFVLRADAGPNRTGRRVALVKSGEDELAPLYPRSWLEDEGLEAVNGRLFALALPAGRYVVDGFYIDGPGYDYHLLGDAIRFDLAAGQILYVGNLAAGFCVRHAYANQSGVAGVRLTLDDASSRDLPLLRRKFRSLQGQTIDVRVPHTPQLANIMEPLSRFCDCTRDCYSDL